MTGVLEGLMALSHGRKKLSLPVQHGFTVIFVASGNCLNRGVHPQWTVPSFVPTTKPYRVLPSVRVPPRDRRKPLLDKASMAFGHPL